MQVAKPRLGELQLLVGQLDGQVDSAFDLGGMSKRREVRQNLQDALKVIPLMTERANEVDAASTELTTLVAEKAGTDDGSVGLAPAPAPEPTHAEPTGGRGAPAGDPAPGSATARAAPGSSRLQHPRNRKRRPSPSPRSSNRSHREHIRFSG